MFADEEAAEEDLGGCCCCPCGRSSAKPLLAAMEKRGAAARALLRATRLASISQVFGEENGLEELLFSELDEV